MASDDSDTETNDQKTKSEEVKSDDTKTGKSKNPPGRPRKIIPKKPIDRLGIVKEPSNLHTSVEACFINIYEILYDNPIMFKRVFGLYKAMNVESVRIRFEESNVKLYAKDNTESSQIYTIMFGEKINRYYNSEIIEFGLSVINMYKILQTLDKDCSKISICSNAQYKRHKIRITLANEEMGEDLVYNLDIEDIPDYDWEVEADLIQEESYPIKFTLPFKRFKKKISDFKLLGDTMKIEKHGKGYLKLSHGFEKGDHITYFRNPAKINLISLLDENEIFSTSVRLEYIKSLSSSLTTDLITISADISRKLIFTLLLDQDESANKEKIAGTEKCQIKILTNIVKSTNV